MTETDWKGNASITAEYLMMRLTQIKFFKFDTGKNWFVQKHPLPDPKKNAKKFFRHRKLMDAEKAFLSSLKPFVAYMTAPTSTDAELYLEEQFVNAKQRIESVLAFSGQMNFFGAKNKEEARDLSANFDRFRYRFLKNVEFLDKYISKMN